MEAAKLEKRSRLSICIPVYNEAKNLPVAIAEVEKLFEGPLADLELEIIVTDNASVDETWQVIGELAKARPHLKAYRFSRNFGYQNSVFAGLSLATGDAVVELDADLEDPPAVIVRFVEKWREGYQVVYGVRTRRFGNPILLLMIRVFYMLIDRLSELKIPQNTGDFRLLDRKVVEVLKALPERNLYLRGLVSYLGFRQLPIEYERDARISGYSKFRILHYFALAVDALTAFTKFPLRLMSIVGVLLFCASAILASYYLIGHFVKGTVVPGFATLVILSLALHGLTFVFLGIQAEYLSRIFDDSKGRPRVIIADSVNDEKAPPIL